MKKNLLLIIALLITFSIISNGENTIITINDVEIKFSADVGYPFIDENNRLLVPFRKVLETYGADVEWDNNIRAGVVSANGVEVIVPIGVSYILRNNEKITIDTNAIIKDGRTYIPIRNVIESLGGRVEWKSETQTVAIYTSHDINNISSTPENGNVFLNEAFTVGEHSVSIMEIVLPEEIALKVNDIALRFQEGVRANPEWFNEYLKMYSNYDGNLPWHENFGISEDEYELMGASGDLMQMRVKQTTVLVVKEKANGQRYIENNEDLEYLSDLVIDNKANVIVNKTGIFEFSHDVVASDGQKATGRWNGKSWSIKYEEPTDLNDLYSDTKYGSIDIHIGRLELTDQLMVVYDQRVIYNGQKFRGSELILFND